MKSFVSYTRDPDYKFARSLTAFLESFHKIPVPVVRGDKRGPQLSPLKVCLDSVTFSLPPAGLQADAGEGSVTFVPSDRSVNPVVESYLAKSRELLVLCSSRTIKSPWVNHEIEWWLAHRGCRVDPFGRHRGEITPGVIRLPSFPPLLFNMGFTRKSVTTFAASMRSVRGNGARSAISTLSGCALPPISMASPRATYYPSGSVNSGTGSVDDLSP